MPGRLGGSGWRAGGEEGEGRFHRGYGIWGCEGLSSRPLLRAVWAGEWGLRDPLLHVVGYGTRDMGQESSAQGCSQSPWEQSSHKQMKGPEARGAEGPRLWWGISFPGLCNDRVRKGTRWHCFGRKSLPCP